MIVAFDIDLTVVDSLSPWFVWIEENLGVTKEEIEFDGNYDLVPQIIKAVQKKNLYSKTYGFLDPMLYWKQDNLYDNLTANDDALRFYNYLKVNGHEVVFVSLCEPEHIKSKIDFVNRSFPNNDGFISTKHKHYVRYDVLFDDRELHIIDGMQHNPNARHILYNRHGVEYNRQIKTQGLEIISNFSEMFDKKVFSHD